MNTRWHLAICQPGQDWRAEENLRLRKHPVFRPTLPAKKANRFGGLEDSHISMFPGYLFVQPSPQYGWLYLRTCPGVIRGDTPLLTRNYRLVSISENDPDFIIIGKTAKQKWADFKGNPSPFKPGDRIRIEAGPWISWMATIEKVDSKHRVEALIDMMGQKVRIDTDLKHVSLV